MTDTSTSTCGQCVGESSTGAKSTAIRTSVNIFEASKRDTPQYFVDVVKDKRRTKNNNLEFLIGWRGFPDPKDDTWVSLDHLSGSEHMIREFNEQWEKDYVRKRAETLQAQAARRKTCQYLPLLCLLRGSSVVWDLYRLTYAGAFWTPP